SHSARATVDGASVLYANTQADTDTAVKPTTEGVEVNTILRSVASPRQLYFRVGLPPSASLVQTDAAAGQVRVVQDGQTIALARPPSATDAEGAPVPVSMSATGDLLTLTVSVQEGDHRWPIAVDPELASVTDSTIAEHSNWVVKANQESKFSHHWASSAVEQWNVGGAISPGEYTEVQYPTKGESKIYKGEVETAGTVHKGVARLELTYGGFVEQSITLAENTSYGATKSTLCANAECSSSAGKAENQVKYKLEAKDPLTETYSLSASLWNTHVYITQEKAPEATFNESEVTIDEGLRANALYNAQYYGEHSGTGSDPWLGPYSATAFEVKAHDPGIGVSWAQIVVGSWHQVEPIYGEGKCKGVQCNESYSTNVTYNPGMPDGEPTILLYAENETGLLSENTQVIKVDSKPPHDLEVSGWPTSREISAAPPALTVEATDGTAPTQSSGVKSISVAIDGGQESTVPNASCNSGYPCTASGKWTLNAEALTEGVHRVIVTASDNAANVASKEFTFDVRHGSAVPVGPGTVDPTTGQSKLCATDVLLAGVGGVSSVYDSRTLAAGVGGTLGPQWAVSLGGGQGLTVLPNGSVVLAGPQGGGAPLPAQGRRA